MENMDHLLHVVLVLKHYSDFGGLVFSYAKLELHLF